MDFSTQFVSKAKKSDENAISNKNRLLPKLSRLEAGYLVLCFCIYLFWTLTFTSWNYGPDEYMRFDVPKFIYLNNALPNGPEESIRNSIWGVSYGFDITLPYIIAGCLMKLVSLFSTNQIALLVAARMTNVLSTIGVGYFAILFMKRFMKQNPIRWLFIILTTMLPQIVFLSSYFNLDSYSLFTVLFILYGWVVCLERSWDRASSIFMAIGLGLCLVGYQFSFSYVLATFMLYVSWHLVYKRKRSVKAFFTTGILILAVVFILCGWRYIRNSRLFNGDFLALHASEPYAEIYAMEGYKPSDRMTMAGNGMSIPDMLNQTSWIATTYESLIGTFGYMNIWLPVEFYHLYLLLIAVGIVGTIFCLVHKIRVCGKNHAGFPKDKLLIGVWMLFATLVTLGISIYYSWASDYQPQGRYIIVAVPFIALVTATGFGYWIDAFCRWLRAEKNFRDTMKIRCGWMMLGFVLLSVFVGYISCLSSFVYVVQQ